MAFAPPWRPCERSPERADFLGLKLTRVLFVERIARLQAPRLGDGIRFRLRQADHLEGPHPELRSLGHVDVEADTLRVIVEPRRVRRAHGEVSVLAVLASG